MMADFNGKYLADKYKNKSHLAQELSRKVHAGATGTPLSKAPDDEGKKTPSRTTRRRTFGITNLEKTFKKNGLITTADEKDQQSKPTAYLSSALTTSKLTNLETSGSPCSEKGNKSSSNNPATPISSQQQAINNVRNSLKKKTRADSFNHHGPAEVS